MKIYPLPAIFCLILLLATSCGKKEDALQLMLHIDTSDVMLTPSDPPPAIQDAAINVLKELYETMDAETSSTFCLQVRQPRGPRTTAVVRFVKKEDGTTGIERETTLNSFSPVISGSDLGWPEIESKLRSTLLSIDTITKFIE